MIEYFLYIGHYFKHQNHKIIKHFEELSSNGGGTGCVSSTEETPLFGAWWVRRCSGKVSREVIRRWILRKHRDPCRLEEGQREPRQGCERYHGDIYVGAHMGVCVSETE